jgi:hypothetical protein
VGGDFVDVCNNGSVLPAADNIAAFGLKPLAVHLPLVWR